MANAGFSDMLRTLGDWLGIFLVVLAISGVVIGISYFIWDYNVGVENSRAQITLEKQKAEHQTELKKMQYPPFTMACYDLENRLVFAVKGLGVPSLHPNNSTGNLCLGDKCAHCSLAEVTDNWDDLQKPIVLKDTQPVK